MTAPFDNAPSHKLAGESLLQRVRTHAVVFPDKPAFIYLADGTRVAQTLSFSELDQRAQTIGAALRADGRVGQTALLLYPAGIEFISAFLGCLYAGVIAIPAPPVEHLRARRDLPRLHAIAADARPGVVLAMEDAVAQVPLGIQQEPAWLFTNRLETANFSGLTSLTDTQIAYLQYTSGSTTAPRGVMVTLANIAAQVAAMASVWDHDPASASVTWMPHFHDYGLVEGLLLPLWTGTTAYILSPAAFLRRPWRWLNAISRFRASRSAGPTFAYEYCVRWSTAIQREREALDLSCWRAATVGAEPVRPSILEQFAATFGPYGFKFDAFRPGYGLAESTLVATVRHPDTAITLTTFDAVALAEGRAAPADSTAGRTLVSVGQPFGGCDLRIVDPHTNTDLPAGQIGEIWVAGPSVTAGYWGRSIESTQTFSAVTSEGVGPFLRTGDLGFTHNGELYVVGRRKELLIVRGRNVYPFDVEETVRKAHPALERADCVAFGLELDGEERLAIVCETQPDQPLDDLRGDIRKAVSETHDLELGLLAFVRPSTIPKTSSGKPQRTLCRDQLLDGTLPVLASWGRRPAADAAEPASLSQWLRAEIARRLALPVDDVDIQTPLHTLGLSSLDALELLVVLEQRIGREVSPVLLYSYPTIAMLASYLEAKPTPSSREQPSASSQSHEPVAIIGVACRFPGADTPEAFWELLQSGGDATGYAPAPRIPGLDAPQQRGGFLTTVDLFDAAHFAITAREALYMDPQQRLTLEVAWQALERAGIAPDRLRGSRTGVFIGASASGYAQLLARSEAPIDAYFATGNAPSVIANRLSYVLDLQGPSLVVDTACSSSLVAIHLACRSLRAGECELALSGGVNLLLMPEVSESLARAGMLALDGRCKPFSAAADGYARGEGCGMLVLRRLGDALHSGDVVLAVIRGSAVNQDGRSNGLSAPNRQAQEQVIAAACSDAGVRPADLGYVEAHGTGTLLGDAVEIAALGAVVGSGRSEADLCLVGSAKSNLGHLEAAAGVAGLIKTVLVLQHGLIPASLHATALNPHLPLAESGLSIATAAVPWSSTRAPRMAGVSSFGFGGTNCHMVLEAAPAPARSTPATADVQLLMLSAWDTAQLRAIAGNYAKTLEQCPSLSLGDLSYTAVTGRSRLPERLAIVADNAATAAARLASFSDGTSPGLLAGRAAHDEQVVFAFSGQGSQYPGMGRELYHTQPLFRAVIDQCADLLGPELDLRQALFDPDGEGYGLDETIVTQPALFALECGLYALWDALGVRPAAVIGHSLGEYTAAYAAGILALDDALRLVAARGRLMQSLEVGAMAAIFAPADEVHATLAEILASVSVAALNGPVETVIAGAVPAVAAAIRTFAERGIGSQRLPVTRAFHSPFVESITAAFRDLAASVPYNNPRIPIAANVNGSIVVGGELSRADYWVEQIRSPVRFAQGVEALARQGFLTFLELGPHPTLTGLGQRIVPGSRWLASLHRRRRDNEQLLESAGALFVAGVAVKPEALAVGKPVRRTILPTTPFRHQRYWPESGSRKELSTPAFAAPSTSQLPVQAREERAVGELPEQLQLTAETLRILSDEEGIVQLTTYLTDVVGAELGQRVVSDLSLLQLGIDSLTSLRLRQRIEQDLGFTIVLTDLFRDIPIDRLAHQFWSAARGGSVSPEEAAALLERVDLLTAAEVDTLLLRLLHEEPS